MKQRMKVVFSIFMSLAMLFSLFPATVQAATTLTSNATGTIDGYNYEYWKDNGTGTMTLNGGGTFSCSWSNINNILFRTGKKLGSTKTYQEYGNISIDYSCNYQPNGNSYMAVYGWTEDPLVEYYIIDSYGTWKPPGNGIAMKGTVTVDGRTYEIYQNSRTGPSIKGNTTFQQYWSICTSKRTSGTISVSEHFKAWEAKGMKMGKMYEVSMVVEGYQSSGKADMTKMNLNVGGPAPSTQPSTQPSIKPSTQPSIKPSTQPSVQPSGSTNNQPLRVLAEKIRAKGHEFYVGAAIPGNFSISDQDIVKKEFDIVTCENNMKIGTISPSRGQYNYSGGDSLVNFAKANDMVVHGHAFVWHKYNPGWVDGTKSMMESYINAVGTHYKGKIYAWDVVNEAFQKDGTYRINAIGSNGQDGASVFGQKQGKQYIEDAFIAARKADPNAKLVYNEYDLETRPAKFDGVYAMVKDFKSRNIPIDGVGFQMHLGPSFTEADAQRFADQMQKLADIGVESYVTEMDVGCSDTTQAGLAKQAEIYGWIAKACAEQPYCRALQVWGIRDSQSWRINPDSPEDRAIAPLIFNDNGQKKPAYYAIQKALADALNSSSIPNPTTPPITVPSLKGDLNDDGIINMADVLLVATSFNATPSFPKYNAAFDLNEDGAINMADVLIIAQNFNKPVTKTSSNPTTKAPPTPTPTKAVSPTVSKNPNAKLLALTFDDGPDNTLTAKVLDKLDKYKVPATFMMIGQKVNSGTSAIIKRIVDSGHEIGNHSWGYDNMGGMSSSAIKDSISKTQAAIKQYAGVTPKFFRAPNLNYSQTLYDAVDLTFVQGVTCNDWSTSTSAADRANAIIAGARDGTILLMHDVQPLPHPTPEALDILIPKLQSQGYEFVTLSELFERKGVALRANDNIAHTTLPN